MTSAKLNCVTLAQNSRRNLMRRAATNLNCGGSKARSLNSDQQPKRRERRRHYPQVLPKYRNPDDPWQTWTGRGKAPLWVNKMLTAGKTLDDLMRLESAAAKQLDFARIESINRTAESSQAGLICSIRQEGGDKIYVCAGCRNECLNFRDP